MRSQTKKLLDWGTAAGELVIVIVGVIIALAVDSWWNDQKEAATEVEHLVALRQEFQSNLDTGTLCYRKSEVLPPSAMLKRGPEECYSLSSAAPAGPWLHLARGCDPCSPGDALYAHRLSSDLRPGPRPSV